MTAFQRQLVVGFLAGIVLGYIAKGVNGSIVALAISGIFTFVLVFIAKFGSSRVIPDTCTVAGALAFSIFAGILLSTGELGAFFTWLGHLIS